MLSAFLERLGVRSSADDEEGPVRSRLDASILVAHGKSADAERELADVQEQAAELEEAHRKAPEE